MIFNNATGQGLRARGLPGLGSMVDLSVPYSLPRGGVGRMGRFGSMVDLSVPYHLPRGGVGGMVDLKLNGLRGYGVTAAEVGSAIGNGGGDFLAKLFSPNDNPFVGSGPPDGYQPPISYNPPSWWGQQSTSTKVMIAGAGFAAVAAGLVFLRGKASRR